MNTVPRGRQFVAPFAPYVKARAICAARNFSSSAHSMSLSSDAGTGRASGNAAKVAGAFRIAPLAITFIPTNQNEIMNPARPSVSRRTFIQQTVALGTVAALATSASSFAASSERRKYAMGLQLYTVRDPMAADPVGTLKKIAAMGYQDLETYGYDARERKYYGFKARDFKPVLRDLGLTTSSGHYDFAPFMHQPIEALDAYVAQCIEGALALDQKFITWPWLDEQSRSIDAFKKVAQRLNRVGEQVTRAGLRFAYHNHDFEFIPHDGQRGYEIILRETDPALVKLQIDLFWAAHSSPWSPHELFTKQPGRFVMWHIKDMDKKDRNRYTELGNGTIDFTKIMPDAQLAGLEYYFVEQGDNFAIDPMHSIATSAEYVKKYL
jgi:sugar phosphate isomerase/epimerase